jgi:nucleoside phosphorylase
MGQPPVPSSRDDFKIAIICALPREVDAVEALFQFNWERNGKRSLPERFTKARGDHNSYSLGYMSGHNIVLAWTPEMGPTSAASTSSSLRSSFPSTRLVLLAGICGAVPEYERNGETTQILLGDVIVSNGLVPYTSVKSYPGESVMRNSLPTPNTEIRAALSQMAHLSRRITLLEEIPRQLNRLLSSHEELQKGYCFPGREHDKLFDPAYIHKHRNDDTPCEVCSYGERSCNKARHETCETLGCDEDKHLVLHRFPKRGEAAERPSIHYGLIGSGDTVMKSGRDRDAIARQHNIIAFEMEGLGVWDNLPTLVVKGACDYADSHKNKQWQNYAAATAAAYVASFLELWRAEDVAAMPAVLFQGELNG